MVRVRQAKLGGSATGFIEVKVLVHEAESTPVAPDDTSGFNDAVNAPQSFHFFKSSTIPPDAGARGQGAEPSRPVFTCLLPDGHATSTPFPYMDTCVGELSGWSVRVLDPFSMRGEP